MFSVVIPLYNKELSVSNTIQSVLNQTIQDFEIVIVNDGSTDQSVKAVGSFNDKRIRLIHQENQGVSAARNKGVEEAKQEWVAFLDGDDLWTTNHLEEITKMMQVFPQEKVYVTSFTFSDNRPMYKHSRKNSIFKINDYFKEAIEENLMWTSIVVAHKTCFEKSGMFNIKLNRGEDLDLWVRIARYHSIIKSNMITATYRINAENRSTSNFNLMRSNVYNYNFENSGSNSETRYYKTHITKCLRGLFLGNNFFLFFKLKQKHNKYIKYTDIFFK
ncbi:glycosyltransferase family 2 protein [Polaribacter sp. IC063]|uniref:glycosyltransferase family 2 protein n=1 Tax=Polaribacter sp. IC063 TaxID=57031 RepID=UPI0011BE55B4|nr:glycosyltransferase family A protein [Polaribacter sp. IC063]TXD51435.1 glycosyltransferase family 2 protein [Polaribacter sp. IC063]